MSTITQYDSKTQTFFQEEIKWVGFHSFAANEAENEVLQRLGALDRFMVASNFSLSSELKRRFALAIIRKGVDENAEALITAVMIEIAEEFPVEGKKEVKARSVWDKLEAKEAALSPLEYVKWLGATVYAPMTREEIDHINDDFDFGDNPIGFEDLP